MSTWSRFWRLVGAEWLKLRTVRRWWIALAAVVPVAVGFGLLTAQGNKISMGDSAPVVGPQGLVVEDQFYFMHQPLNGDGTITVRVLGQQADHPETNPGAGIVIKAKAEAGAAYAAIWLTPQAGIRMSSNFGHEISGPRAAGPYWLRLSRAGSTVTGEASADGTSWQRVGRVNVPQLSATAEIGLFASSPPQIKLEKSLGSTSVGMRWTTATATFDNLSVAGSQVGQWTGTNVGLVERPEFGKKGMGPRGGTQEADGVYTLTGSGRFADAPLPEDPVETALFSLFFGLLLLIPVSVLFITSEHRRPLLGSTFAASPQRGLVMAAKATVIASTGLVLGLSAAILSFLVAMPTLRANGFRPPLFASVSLGQADVWRAIIGSGVLFAALAVLAFALGAIMRHSAAAIASAIALVVIPMFAGTPLPLTAARWLMYLTPAGGFSVQRIKAPDPTLVEPWAMIGPWPGMAAVLGWAAITLLIGVRLTRKRDA